MYWPEWIRLLPIETTPNMGNISDPDTSTDHHKYCLDTLSDRRYELVHLSQFLSSQFGNPYDRHTLKRSVLES